VIKRLTHHQPSWVLAKKRACCSQNTDFWNNHSTILIKK
jgi:hypothetical protein